MLTYIHTYIYKASVLRNVGQLLVELHDPDTKHRAIHFLEKIEAQV